MGDSVPPPPKDLGPRSTLLVDKHAEYIASFAKIWEASDRLEHVATEHFWMSGLYWGLTALNLMGRAADLDAERVTAWVLSCAQSAGPPGGLGFGGSPRNDPHLLYTLSAVQILALLDRLELVDADAVMMYVASLQQPDGSFAGDAWGEVDTRFSYAALLTAAILGRLPALDVAAAVEFVAACKNFDGGFGCVPGNESHAGQVFTCIGTLALAGALNRVDRDLFCWWLCERQTRSGGLNGRPEKLPDVCYSWWCLSCLAILGRLHWIDRDALAAFILHCQDEEDGGISDRPEDMADVYHTFFGVAGLSLVGYPGLAPIDPAWALPLDVVQRLQQQQQQQQQPPGGQGAGARPPPEGGVGGARVAQPGGRCLGDAGADAAGPAVEADAEMPLQAAAAAASVVAGGAGEVTALAPPVAVAAGVVASETDPSTAGPTG